MVGTLDGFEVGLPEGGNEGKPLGTAVGRKVGLPDGAEKGTALGTADGIDDGFPLGSPEGTKEGTPLGSPLGNAVGEGVGAPGVIVGRGVGLDDGDVGSALGIEVGIPDGMEVGYAVSSILRAKMMEGIFMSSPAFIVTYMSSSPISMSISIIIIYFLSTPSIICATLDVFIASPSMSPSMTIVNTNSSVISNINPDRSISCSCLPRH